MILTLHWPGVFVDNTESLPGALLSLWMNLNVHSFAKEIEILLNFQSKMKFYFAFHCAQLSVEIAVKMFLAASQVEQIK